MGYVTETTDLLAAGEISDDEARRRYERFVDECQLAVPEEVGELFEAYTRLIWQYKEVGRIYDFYSDVTTSYGENGRVSMGADGVLAGTLSFMRSFPDRRCVFVDIFAEGDQESGYHFGQTTRFHATNTGCTKYGAPTGKELEPEGTSCFSICECEVRKVEGRWRIVNEWVVESADAIDETTRPDEHVSEPASESEDVPTRGEDDAQE
ncbi:hypothetical protein [Thermophilibacter sp.]